MEEFKKSVTDLGGLLALPEVDVMQQLASSSLLSVQDNVRVTWQQDHILSTQSGEGIFQYENHEEMDSSMQMLLKICKRVSCPHRCHQRTRIELPECSWALFHRFEVFDPPGLNTRFLHNTKAYA